ncbi:MAG: carboxypeptidase-like regulatory domain-containing protein [Aridibacter sp.]
MKVLQKISFALLFCFVFSAFAVAQETGSVKGKVHTEDGDKIVGAKISVRLDGEDLKSTTSDLKGEFRLSDLTPGRYNLVFEKKGFSSGVLYNVEIRSKKTNNLKDRLILSIDRGTLIIVEASIFNHNGISIYGAKVQIEEVYSDGKTKKVGSGYSSRDGDIIFRFKERPTKYRVTASVKDITANKEIEVNEAAIYRTAITLDLSKNSNR